MRYFFLVFVLFFLHIGLIAQRQNDADAYFDSRNFNKAKDIYAMMLKSHPQDALLNYKYGVCLVETGGGKKAIEPLTVALKKIPQASIYLGDAYFQEYRFQEAVSVFKTALESMPVTDANYNKLVARSEKAAMALRMLSSVEDIRIIDSMVVDKKNFFSNYKLMADAGRIFSLRNETDTTSILPLTGFMTQRQDRMFYADTLGGQTDIFTSYKLMDGWSEKQALSSTVNTVANENFPFVLSDGITLYFCSDGKGSLGGYDIFVTRFNSDKNDYFAPVNIGMPFNSPYNDYLMAIDDENKVGWFATDRYQKENKVIIYKFKPNDKKTFVSTTNVDSLTKLAQLKAYKLYSPQPEAVSDSSIVTSDKVLLIPQMHFVVNDSVVYSSVGEFKSEEAKIAYQTALDFEEKLRELHQQTEDARKNYALTKTEVERKAIASDIQKLESEIGELRLEPLHYMKKARVFEITEIQKNKAVKTSN